jgi:hypothetical protein
MKIMPEGALYKILTVFDQTFEVRYGYYEDFERENKNCYPVPIYPNFLENPIYTKEGYPFVTKIQELCSFGSSGFADGCCADCPHFSHGEELIGICLCPENRRDAD